MILKQGRERPVRQRHPWVFSGAIDRLEGDPQPGQLVAVLDYRRDFLATGYYNPRSQIRARLLTWNSQEAIDDSFWRSRLERAVQARNLLGLEPETSACRLVNAEADGLPGLVVDRYADYLVMQCLTLGIAHRRALLIELLADLLQPAGIYDRSDVDVRRKEGLELAQELAWGHDAPSQLAIHENGLAFQVDIRAGQKTGFYLDQRENRAIIGSSALVGRRTVLNVFAYTGAFSVYAAAGNAGPITNVDSSLSSLELAEHNMLLNGYVRPVDEYIAGDAFEVLRYFRDTGRQFDVVILDPPKFARSRADVERASRGYKDLNWLACNLLSPDGLLATFSCSGHISADLFQKILFGAALDAGRDVQILRPLSQAPDHPVLLTFPESAYLKGLLCRVR